MLHARLRVPAQVTALGAPLLLAALMTSGAAPATAAAARGSVSAPAYQVLVTSAPGGPHPVTVPERGQAPATPAVTLRLGSKTIAVRSARPATEAVPSR